MTRKALALSLLILLISVSAHAMELEGVTLDDTAEIDGQTLVLNGAALRSVVWFDVYVAGLYLPERTNDAETALAMSGPVKMAMVFKRDVGRDDICKAWKEGFEKNLEDEGAGLMTQLNELCAATPEEIKDGQIMEYTYLPSQDATLFTVDGQTLGTYPGRDFYTGMLSCWLGPKPGPGKGFKKGLLGID